MKLLKIDAPLIYGTHNRAKLDAMRRYVRPLGIVIEGLPPGTNIPPVDESGSDPLENAQIKAYAFYRALHRPVFSCDSGLFFDGVPAEEQPGTHVRRVQGRELTDDEMIEYYAALAAKHGGRLNARYRNAICLIFDEDHIYRSMADSLSGERFLLIDTPHPQRIAGFPLDSLSIDPNTGKYYFDLPERGKRDTGIQAGFVRFFKQVFQNEKE